MTPSPTNEAVTEIGDEWEKRSFIRGKSEIPGDVYSRDKSHSCADRKCMEPAEKSPSKSSVNDEEESQRRGCLRNICSTHKGIFIALLSCCSQSLSSIGIKMLAGNIAATEIASFRLLFYFIFASVCMVFFRISPRISRTQALWLFMRVTVGTTAMCLSFFSYQNIPVGDATAIFFTSPIFTGILAWLILGEKFTIVDAIFAVIAVTGILLIAKPSFIFGDLSGQDSTGEGNTLLGIMCAVMGAICASVVFVSVRKLGGINVHPLLQIWFFGFFGMTLAAVLTAILGMWTIPRCGRDRVILVFISFIGALSQFFLTYAIKLEKPTYVAVIKTNTVILAFILEYLFFKTIPFWLSILGAVLVVISSLGITLQKWMSAKEKFEEDHANKVDGVKRDCDNEDSKYTVPDVRSRGKVKC